MLAPGMFVFRNVEEAIKPTDDIEGVEEVETLKSFRFTLGNNNSEGQS